MLRIRCGCRLSHQVNRVLDESISKNIRLLANCIFSKTSTNFVASSSQLGDNTPAVESSKTVKQNADVFGNLRKGFIEPSRRRKNKDPNPVPDVARRRLKSWSSKREELSSPNVESDVFGLLDPKSEARAEDLPMIDEGEKLMEAYENRTVLYSRNPLMYKRQIIQFLRERRLKEALGVLAEMTQKARLLPDYYTYNRVIGECGRAGYTKMAFKLYRQMKDRQINPDNSTYTALFNACSNSPWPKDGLKRVLGFYDEVTRKGILLNSKNYHAAIKAFGRCGDLQMAFRLVDEMAQNGLGVTCETFNFLLSSCASDHQTGFLHAIGVWRKLQEKKIKPDSYSYNLLLRIVRDCGLGDPEVASKLLLTNRGSTLHGQRRLSTSDLLMIPNQEAKSLLSDQERSSKELMLSLQIPDILSPTGNSGSAIALQAAEKPQDRLFILGGMTGLLQRMDKDNVKPELKTFTELLEVIPSKWKEEEHLLAIMKERGVTPDIDFFNVLIKKRSCRGDIVAAKDVLTLIAKENLHVDIATFGTLATCCTNWKNAKQLLQEMENAGFRPNIQIMGAIINGACRARDFWFILDMLKSLRNHEIEPDPKLLTTLETCIDETKQFILKQEKDGTIFNSDDKRIKSFRSFLMYYKQWLKDRKVDLPQHPWQAYRDVSEREEEDGDEDELQRLE